MARTCACSRCYHRRTGDASWHLSSRFCRGLRARRCLWAGVPENPWRCHTVRGRVGRFFVSRSARKGVFFLRRSSKDRYSVLADAGSVPGPSWAVPPWAPLRVGGHTLLSPLCIGTRCQPASFCVGCQIKTSFLPKSPFKKIFVIRCFSGSSPLLSTTQLETSFSSTSMPLFSTANRKNIVFVQTLLQKAPHSSRPPT